MAYGLKYQRPWTSTFGVKGFLYIDEADYTGTVTQLELKKEDEDDFKIEYKFDNWEFHLIGLTAEFNIINNKADFYELLPLLTAEERQFRVRITITEPIEQARTLFQGFLNVDTNSQRMLHFQDINLVASSFISKLEFQTIDDIEERKGMYFINLIDAILRTTGGEFDIRVNSSLYAQGSPLSGAQTLYNKNGVFTELFWEDNVKRKTNEEILEIILITFNSYLYWKDGKWYIERYKDLWNETPSYVEYTTGTTYHDASTGTIINTTRKLVDIHSLVFLGNSQTISIDPGFKEIQLNLNIEDHLLLNLTVNEFSSVPDATLSPPAPPKRTWEKYSGYTWELIGSYYNISQAIKVSLLPSPQKHYGLYTRFNVTIGTSETSLNINFKYGRLIKYTGAGGAVEAYNFNWYLRIDGTNNFIVYNDSSDSWELVTASEATAINTTVASGSVFDNATFVGDITATVPLGETTGLIVGASYSVVLCIGSATVEAGSTIYPFGIFGDVVLTTNNALEDNEISGVINTRWLEKKEVDVDIIDLKNDNYIAGILQDNTLEGKTENWSDDGVTFIPIVDHLLIDLFRLYNVSRQNIKGSIRTSDMYDPFTLFYDSKQGNKKFILGNHYYFPAFDQAELELLEYDNETVVTLNG